MFLAGGYEFQRKDSKPGSPFPLLDAFSFLQYDLGVSTQSETTAFHPATELQNWKAFSKEPKTEIRSTSFGKIQFIFLPEIDELDEIAKYVEPIDFIIRNGQEDETISLIVAFSPWGERLEASYLEKAKYPPHILLGSNEGSPITKLKAQRKTLWIRPELWGASITEIQCYKFPSKATHHAWVRGSVRTSLLELGDSVPENKKVLELID